MLTTRRTLNLAKIVHKTVKKGDVLKINEARGGFAISLLAK